MFEKLRSRFLGWRLKMIWSLVTWGLGHLPPEPPACIFRKSFTRYEQMRRGFTFAWYTSTALATVDGVRSYWLLDQRFRTLLPQWHKYGSLPGDDLRPFLLWYAVTEGGRLGWYTYYKAMETGE